MPSELGPLEMRILGLLEGCPDQTVTQVQQRLSRDGSSLAYTTVMTVLSRLHEKGIVNRKRDGRRYAYRLGSAAAGIKRSILARVHQALFRGNRLRPIVALVDDSALSVDELVTLRRMIDARVRGKKP